MADFVVFGGGVGVGDDAGAGVDVGAGAVQEDGADGDVEGAAVARAQDAEVANFRDWGIPLGRRFRALKLWFLLLDQGVEGLQARLRRDLANAAWLEAQVRAEPGWELLAPVPLQTLCLRHVPDSLAGDEAALATHNLDLARRINEGGQAFLTPAVLKGRQMIRVSIGAESTERPQVEALWADLRRLASV